MCIHLFGTPLVLLCSLSPCCSDRSHTLEHLKHHFDDNQVIPLTYDPLLFKTERKVSYSFSLCICYKTSEKIILTHAIKKCTYLERRPSGRPWGLESLFWTGVNQSGGTFTNGILLSSHDARLFFLIFMGKGSILWDNCSFLTHFTIISESACQCFLAYSLIELETVLVLPMICQR